MGFKDLVAFNVAMLGKQGWRFQTEPDSLVAKVFKAKYYPNSNFLGSKLGHNPSFVWRNIFSAKLIVGKGERWKIRNGFDIPIISELWLGADSSIPPVSQAAMSLRGYTVGNLMQQNSKSWNEEIVRHIFTEETTQMILNIPLFPQVRINWCGNRKRMDIFR